MKHIFNRGKVTSSEIANLTFEPVFCVSSKSRKRCYVACSDKKIIALELDSFDIKEVIMTSTQPIQYLAISHDSNYLYIFLI